MNALHLFISSPTRLNICMYSDRYLRSVCKLFSCHPPEGHRDDVSDSEGSRFCPKLLDSKQR